MLIVFVCVRSTVLPDGGAPRPSLVHVKRRTIFGPGVFTPAGSSMAPGSALRMRSATCASAEPNAWSVHSARDLARDGGGRASSRRDVAVRSIYTEWSPCASRVALALRWRARVSEVL